MTNAAEIPWDREQVLAASMDPMAVISDGQHVAVNQPYANLYGFSRPDDLAGEALNHRLVTDEQERFEQEILPTCCENGQWRGTVTGRQQKGSAISLEMSIAQLNNGYFVCTVRETETDEPNERVVDSHDGLIEHVFDAVDDIIAVLDEDGSVVLWNERLRETTGYTDAEIEAIDPKEFIAPEQHEYVSGLVEAIDELGDQPVDLDLVTKDGERIPHEFRGTTFEDPRTGQVYRCGIIRDVTERKERERKLRTARQFNEELVENAPFGMFRLDEDHLFSQCESTTLCIEQVYRWLCRSKDALRLS